MSGTACPAASAVPQTGAPRTTHFRLAADSG